MRRVCNNLGTTCDTIYFRDQLKYNVNALSIAQYFSKREHNDDPRNYRDLKEVIAQTIKAHPLYVDSILSHHLQRWPNNKTTLG